MAYMNQERKKERAPKIKAVLKKYGMKGTIGVRHYSSLVVNLKSGKLDILGAMDMGEYQRDYVQVNPYWIKENFSDPQVVAFLEELKAAMFGDDYFDESDIMTDYFHCSHYIDINVGQFDKPYILEA